MNIFNAYRVLGCNPASTDEEIKAAHRRLSRECHPDKGGQDLSKFDEIQKSYKLIKDGRARFKLSTLMSGLGDECETCGGKGFRPLTKGWVRIGTETCARCSGAGYIERTK